MPQLRGSPLCCCQEGRFLLYFNNDSKVVVLGYTRLVMIFFAYIFSMLYENMSGCLRCFGISIIPAVLTVLGLCGVRIFRIIAVFSNHRTFRAILTAYPVSLSVTALLILMTLVVCRLSRRAVIKVYNGSSIRNTVPGFIGNFCSSVTSEANASGSVTRMMP